MTFLTVKSHISVWKYLAIVDFLFPLSLAQSVYLQTSFVSLKIRIFLELHFILSLQTFQVSPSCMKKEKMLVTCIFSFS